MKTTVVVVLLFIGLMPNIVFAAPPNLVFILADDLGIGDLGCYGGQVIPTPNIDRVAREGMRFTQAYSGSTVCAPSRCALMTGFHTGHGIVRANTFTPPEGQMPLLEGTITLGSLMKQAGYATGAFGKWALGGPGSTGEPAKQGFDAFFGYLCQNQAHEFYPTMLRRHAEAVTLDGKTYSHSLVMDEALGFIRQHRKQPFFVYLPVTLPHGKLDVPDASAFADKPWPQPLKNYAAMVALLDKDVGRVLNLLNELSIDEKTIVFFASDNGAEVYYFKEKSSGSNLVPDYIRELRSHGNLRGYKRDLYEGGIRVPFIARGPGFVQPGLSDHVCAFWDVLPTFAELIGSKPPENLDGISFLPTLTGNGEQPKHSHLYWEFHEVGFGQAVRFDKWKAIRRGPVEEVELYDLSRDEGESNNLASQNPNQVERALASMKSSRTENAAYPIKPKTITGSGFAK